MLMQFLMKGGNNMTAAILPQLDFGSNRISRLIAGANTINGGSHLSRFTNMQMKSYFTMDRILEHLRLCEEAGVNTWQSSHGNLDIYRLHKERGGTLLYLSLGCESENERENLREARAVGTLGIAHHGEVTDQLFKGGHFDKVREYCKQVRETGMMVGISSHMPDALERVLDEGWDVDYFMCCIYERHRTREELERLLGHVPIPVSEVYLESDPPRMFKIMRQANFPCLAFKILAAGRLCENQESVELAFQSALSQIKANDGLIVGMYPEFEDQVALNASYVRKHGNLSGKMQKQS
jgi:hypothetical protein